MSSLPPNPPSTTRIHHSLAESQGWRRTSSMVNRRFTSTSKHPRMRFCKSVLSLTLGLEILPALAASASAKGHSPVHRMERRTPRDHTSEAGAL